MTLDDLYIYILVALTSGLVYYLAVKRFRLNPKVLRPVFEEFSQCIGAFILFLLLNAGIGVVGAFFIRTVWRFFPLHTVTDLMLVFLSAIQGFLFQLWWRRSRG